MFIKYLYKYLASGQITTATRGIGITRGRTFRTATRHRSALSTGGFIEIVRDNTPNTSYIRIHLGQPKHPQDLDETYKYVRYGKDKEIDWLLRELRESAE